jgi:predicted O-methyltransferase YrrM
MDVWQTVSGQTMDFELGYLQRLVATLPEDAVIVELGVCQGRSLCALALACRSTNRVVYGVDDFNPDNPGYVTPDYEEAQANVKKLELTQWVRIIKGDSTQTGLEWQGPKVSLLFHDASHLYDKVKADLEAWLPHVEGYVCLHDYTGESVEQIGVSQAANELLGKPIEVYPRLGVFKWTGQTNA